MVQLYAISIFRTDVKPAVKLVSAQDVSSFGFFQRSAVSQFIEFFSQTVAERTPPGNRQDVQENSVSPLNFMLRVDYVGHIYARQDKIVGVLLSDKDYPVRVAHTLLSKILDEFLVRYPPSSIKSPDGIVFPELDGVCHFWDFD